MYYNLTSQAKYVFADKIEYFSVSEEFSKMTNYCPAALILCYVNVANIMR